MGPPPTSPPPGWYPDPAGGPGGRFWDGAAWTGHTVPPSPAPYGAGPYGPAPAPPYPYGPAAPPSPYPSPPPYGSPYGPAAAAPWRQMAKPAVVREARLAGWARLSLAAVAAVGVLYGLLPVVYSSDVAALFHWVHLAFNAARAVPRRTAPPVPVVVPSYVRLVYLGDLVYIVVGIVFLVWQHRAADAANRLGLPAHHRPGWGVAFWFIPIASLWCPYQALRDCLPPDHPGRRMALWCWLAYLAAGLVGTAVAVTAPYHRPVAVVLLVVEGVLLVFVATAGGRLIGAVERAHRELVGA